jgi:thiol:disulfide interchange protein DsbD
VCEKICIPGDGIVNLSLPIAPANSPANIDLFARFQKQLPTPPATDFSASWKGNAAGLVLRVSHPDLGKFSSVEFVPSPPENVAVGHPRLASRDGNVSTFDVPLDNANGKFKSLPGLLVFGSSNDAPDRSAWDISVGHEMAAANEKSALSEIIRFLIFGFIGGFILNLMPCVLPVISLKIFGFILQAGQSRARIFRSGLAFIAGIFVWFLGLALVLVIIKSAGGQPVWAAQFTNPYFVLAMSGVVLVFALNLFGVFEINLPQWLSRRAVAAESAHGDAGSFFQGVFATILATPCTAPFLGTALGFAFTQSAIVILAIFASIALGMSLPYFLLSAQPAWLKFLPKPGPWMLRVKQLMGFLLIATLLFLLSVLGAQRGVAALIWTCAFLLVLSVVCWLKGAFLTPIASARTRTFVLLFMLLLLIGGGYYFIGEKFQNASVAASQTASAGSGWEKFTPERLASELQQGHPVFIDFTAEWCITCKFNESTVLETAAVRAAFSEHQIVKLKADWTNGDPAITKLLKQFGRPGVPLYVLYPGGSAKPYVFPELLTKTIVLEKLETINRNIASQ